MMKNKMVEPETGAMRLKAFEAMLETHGAAMRRWPAPMRAPAQALLANSPEARAALRAAADLDEALDQAPVPVIDEARVAGIVAASLGALPARRPVAASRGRHPFGALLSFLSPANAWPRAAGLAACMAAGILVGLVQPLPTVGSGDGNAVMTAGNDNVATDLAGALANSSSVESLFQ